MLLEDTPAILSLGKLCEDLAYKYEWHTGRKHNSSTLAERSIAIRRTTYQSLSLVYRPALQAPLHLHLQHQYCRKQSISHQQEVRVWVGKYEETRRIDQKKPKTK